MIEKVVKLWSSLVRLYSEFKELPMKFKISSLCGILALALVVVFTLFGCGVEQGFVDLMESSNKSIIAQWEKTAILYFHTRG